MKVYLEFVFIINFLLDFMILYGTKRLLKINKTIIKVIIGSLIGSITTFILFIDISNLLLFIIKIIISSLMIIVSFGFNNFFKNIFYFYMISIILGGFIYLFDLSSNYYFNMFILLICFPIIIYIFIKEVRNYRLNYKDKYDVCIYFDNKKYRLEGFIDTGNRLESPIKKEGVILVNLKINCNNVIYIPYKALNYTGIIPCFRPDKIIINNKNITNCLVGLSNDKFNINGINCILPNKLKEDL